MFVLLNDKSPKDCSVDYDNSILTTLFGILISFFLNSDLAASDYLRLACFIICSVSKLTLQFSLKLF